MGLVRYGSNRENDKEIIDYFIVQSFKINYKDNGS